MPVFVVGMTSLSSESMMADIYNYVLASVPANVWDSIYTNPYAFHDEQHLAHLQWLQNPDQTLYLHDVVASHRLNTDQIVAYIRRRLIREIGLLTCLPDVLQSRTQFRILRQQLFDDAQVIPMEVLARQPYAPLFRAYPKADFSSYPSCCSQSTQPPSLDVTTPALLAPSPSLFEMFG